jgi:uncharacterized iron-regulated membrane protein
VDSGGKSESLVSVAHIGQIVGTVESGWIDWTIDLHRNPLYGKSGRNTVGAFGVTLFVLAGTGLLLWIVGARSWRAWISVGSPGSSRRFNFQLHRAVGLWSYVLLAVVFFTDIRTLSGRRYGFWPVSQ